VSALAVTTFLLDCPRCGPCQTWFLGIYPGEVARILHRPCGLAFEFSPRPDGSLSILAPSAQAPVPAEWRASLERRIVEAGRRCGVALAVERMDPRPAPSN
jgi:hypothetical protein